MLTQEQIEKLKTYTNHPKFGQILIDAIEVWKRDDVNPEWGIFGIDLDDSYCWICENSCCLIGASLVNKKYYKEDEDSSVLENADHHFQINDEWITYAIYQGFDQTKDYIPNKYQEAYNFGKEISLILFGEID